jgi:CheY-like chemotaxis protein
MSKMMREDRMKTVPIIAVTAYESSVWKDFLDAGAWELTMKPITALTLQSFLKEFAIQNDNNEFVREKA